MLIVWIRKRKTKEQKDSSEENKKLFTDHSEDMKKFRLAHSDMNIMSAADILTSDGDILAPVNNVKLSENAHN